MDNFLSWNSASHVYLYLACLRVFGWLFDIKRTSDTTEPHVACAIKQSNNCSNPAGPENVETPGLLEGYNSDGLL